MPGPVSTRFLTPFEICQIGIESGSNTVRQSGGIFIAITLGMI